MARLTNGFFLKKLMTDEASHQRLEVYRVENEVRYTTSLASVAEDLFV